MKDLKTRENRELPTNRIGVLFIWLNSFTALMVLVSIVIGKLAAYGQFSVGIHIIVGLTTSVIGLFGLVAAMFYLITTGGSMKEALLSNNLPLDIYRKTAKLKGKLFPWCSIVLLLLIALPVLGGAVHVGKVEAYVHLYVSIATFLLYFQQIRVMKRVFNEDRHLMADTLDAINSK